MQQFQLLLLQAVQRNLPLAAQGKLVFEIQPLCAVMEQSGAAGLIHVRPPAHRQPDGLLFRAQHVGNAPVIQIA